MIVLALNEINLTNKDKSRIFWVLLISMFLWSFILVFPEDRSNIFDTILIATAKIQLTLFGVFFGVLALFYSLKEN